MADRADDLSRGLAEVIRADAAKHAMWTEPFRNFHEPARRCRPICVQHAIHVMVDAPRQAAGWAQAPPHASTPSKRANQPRPAARKDTGESENMAADTESMKAQRIRANAQSSGSANAVLMPSGPSSTISASPSSTLPVLLS